MGARAALSPHPPLLAAAAVAGYTQGPTGTATAEAGEGSNRGEPGRGPLATEVGSARCSLTYQQIWLRVWLMLGLKLWLLFCLFIVVVWAVA